MKAVVSLLLSFVALSASFQHGRIVRAPLMRPLRAVTEMPAPAPAIAAASTLQSQVSTQAKMFPSLQSSPMSLAVKETREGIYGTYEVDVAPQKYDKAEGTFKTAEKTKAGKNKYVAVLGVFLVGSFVIPMLQYFWYVREE